MTRTYKAIGINLKGVPIGEKDRLMTILTLEYGLVRAIAPGARKHTSSLRGRSELFVVNELLIAKGRSLDKITQAETIESYPGLSRDLQKLTASQYLAELVLCFANSQQPHTEVYHLLNEHLSRIEKQTNREAILADLAHAVFHFLVLAGIAPQIHVCCVTRTRLIPNQADPNWQVGFSFPAGGIVSLSENLTETINHRLGAVELSLLQQLGEQSLIYPSSSTPHWATVERLLRDYAQYHYGRCLKSAAFIDALCTLK